MDWLFLRGLSREQRHWGDFLDVFASRVGGARVHRLDLPGTGTEWARPTPGTIHGIAEDLRERFLALREGHPGPWAILGMSLGGMVAMAWCEAHPGDFARACLVSTSSADLASPLRRFHPRAAVNAVRALLETDPVVRERLVLATVTRLASGVPEIAARWARFQEDRPVARATVIRQLRAAAAYRAPASLPIPALVIAGEGDALVDPLCARLLAERLGAPLALHPEGGHELALDAPAWLADQVAAWAFGPAHRAEDPAAPGARLGSLGGGRLPLLIEPSAGAGARDLEAWLTEHRAFVEEKLVAHGALLARGFAVGDAAAFERVARAVSPDLKNDYLGTSPRDGLTQYVFSASELPPYYPIPEHCEMSFIRRPPRRLFFCCLLPPEGPGGETPLVDFRAVYRDLDPEVRARFAEKGVMNIRNYDGPQGGSAFDLWKLKRWDEVFSTTDRAAVEARCRDNGFDFAWGPRGRLRLTNVQPAQRPHPVTGEPTWFNHAQVFHLSAVPDEYRRIAERQRPLPHAALAAVAGAAVRLRGALQGPMDQAMHCTFGDGTPIPDGDMDKVRDAIWKNMVFFPWRKGDVLVVDNDAVAHGRMPYRGPRTVAVAWA